MDGAPPARQRAGRGALRYRFSGILRGVCALGIVRRQVQGLRPRARREILHARTLAVSSHRLEKNERPTVESIKRSLGVDDDLEDFPLAKRAA